MSPKRLFASCERVKLSEPRGQEVTESPKGGCLALNIAILADYWDGDLKYTIKERYFQAQSWKVYSLCNI